MSTRLGCPCLQYSRAPIKEISQILSAFSKRPLPRFLQLGCLARCNGLEVEMGGPNTSSLEDLRAAIEECSSEDRGKVVVVSYDRSGLQQTGSGHFSPIGGYHEAQDMVLILDTARFKLPSHWVPLTTLWNAMKPLDPETGKPRGFMVLQKAYIHPQRLFTANSVNYKDWPKVRSCAKLCEGMRYFKCVQYALVSTEFVSAVLLARSYVHTSYIKREVILDTIVGGTFQKSQIRCRVGVVALYGI